MVIETTETSVRLEDSTGFRFNVPRRYTVDGETRLLKVGMLISAEIKIGTQTELENIFVESPVELSERVEFDGAALSDVNGWEPRNSPMKDAGTGTPKTPEPLSRVETIDGKKIPVIDCGTF